MGSRLEFYAEELFKALREFDADHANETRKIQKRGDSASAAVLKEMARLDSKLSRIREEIGPNLEIAWEDPAQGHRLFRALRGRLLSFQRLAKSVGLASAANAIEDRLGSLIAELSDEARGEEFGIDLADARARNDSFPW